MNKVVHTVYVWSMVAIVVVVTFYLAFTGYSYYSLPLEERFYHEMYEWFKPSGLFGQGLGVIGTLMIAFGVGIYIARKRYGFMERFIRLKYLLEFHIFLCVLGPILILFHTTFKFGGIVSIAFWSMVAVVLSGVIGRFIYIQIPRTIEGRELSLQEIQKHREELINRIRQHGNEEVEAIVEVLEAKQSNGEATSENPVASPDYKRRRIKGMLSVSSLPEESRRAILHLVDRELSLEKRVSRLEQMKKLFQYWHVVHMPFALIMLIIVVIHIAVTVALGFRWIF